MNDLHMNRVEGIRVLIYGTTFDAPGRRDCWRCNRIQRSIRVHIVFTLGNRGYEDKFMEVTDGISPLVPGLETVSFIFWVILTCSETSNGDLLHLDAPIRMWPTWSPVRDREGLSVDINQSLL